MQVVGEMDSEAEKAFDVGAVIANELVANDASFRLGECGPALGG